MPCENAVSPGPAERWVVEDSNTGNRNRENCHGHQSIRMRRLAQLQIHEISNQKCEGKRYPERAQLAAEMPRACNNVAILS
jgi:hypothetical protein